MLVHVEAEGVDVMHSSRDGLITRWMGVIVIVEIAVVVVIHQMMIVMRMIT